MIDLSKPPNMEKIGWFLNGFVKLNVVGLIFFLSFLVGAKIFLVLKDYVIFEAAIILGFLCFFSLAIVLVILINKYRIVERFTDDWYQKKWNISINNYILFVDLKLGIPEGKWIRKNYH